MEVLVEKIFDLAFMPTMNGESGCLHLWELVAWVPGDTGLLGMLDVHLSYLNSISEHFL